MLNAIRLPFGFYFTRRFVSRNVSGPQMAPQTNIQGDCDAHYNQSANTQNHEPPDHPHDGVE
jgi:hypothetical protein